LMGGMRDIGSLLDRMVTGRAPAGSGAPSPILAEENR
jgi:hypothetical protein